MSKILALLSCFIFVSGLAGCGWQNEKIPNQPELGSEVQEEDVLHEVWEGEPTDEVFPDFFGDQTQRSAFPDFMVGVWEADKYDWAFTFEPDGSISHLVHMVWALPIDIEKGGFYTEGPDEGTYAAFVMGPCETQYNANTRELRVKIVLEMFQMILPQADLEGKARDFFAGPVSEDGTIWTASWWHFGWLEGATPPDPDPPSIQLVFKKLKIE